MVAELIELKKEKAERDILSSKSNLGKRTHDDTHDVDRSDGALNLQIVTSPSREYFESQHED